MKNLKQLSQLGLMAALIGMTAAALATDGTPGATSTGTLSLSVTVPNIIVIRDVTDPAPANFDGSTDIDFSDSVCVGTNGAAGYTITATSVNTTSTNFELVNGTDTVQYNVAWANSSGATSGTAFGTSGATQNFNAGPVSNIGCATTNATAVITVPAANLQAVPAQTYTDTLNLTVAPL
jgi:hypothetical protein